MTAPAPGGWRDIQPDLSGEPYVFAAGEPPAGVSPFAVIREDEGVTVILTRADADQAGLAYDYVAATAKDRIEADIQLAGVKPMSCPNEVHADAHQDTYPGLMSW